MTGTSKTRIDRTKFAVVDTYRIKLLLLMVTCVAVLGFFHEKAMSAKNKTDLTAQEKRGKRIYLRGESSDGSEITAVISELDVPASTMTCANCHGWEGEGIKEGGIHASPLTWEVLTRPNTSPSTGRQRGAYDESSLARSIKSGSAPDGSLLQTAMPRYRMTEAQMADLIAYLKKLGKESPGITDNTIRIGAVLPMTGPLSAVGEDVNATLVASFAQLNSQGGIHNRRFELVVEDSGGNSRQTADATLRLLEEGDVFALVGSFEPDSIESSEFISESKVPLVGPPAISPRTSLPPNPYIFYLLPTFGDQARTLVDFARSKALGKPARLAVVYADTGFERDARQGFQSQVKMYSMEIVAEHKYRVGQFEAAKAAELLSQKKPDYIFFFGSANDITAFAGEMERVELEAALLSSSVMIGKGAFTLPARVASRTYLSYPNSLPNQNDFNEFLTTMQKSGVRLRSPAFQSLAYAATKIFFEAAKLSGRQLDRKTLVNSLEQLKDFKTGVVPPATFGPNRRTGSTGSYIVGIEYNNKQLVPLSARLSPQENP